MEAVWPMPPPRKMSTPSTSFPVESLHVVPSSPMSPSWICPHVFGHPVQWTRTSLPSGNSNFSSMSCAYLTAYPLVLILLCPQNWFPAHATVPFIIGLGSRSSRWMLSPAAIAPASLSSGMSSTSTLPSTVMRMVPEPKSSAIFAMAFISSAYILPAGITRPIQFLPSFCLFTPTSSLLFHSLGTRLVSAVASSSPVDAL
mmetsp:Transcript_69679/g.145299  ORF Transcript_69679/g.145299 Transcript_69679/m.145299 type:complete len:200 (-) Transcript_69679:1242-1841(-)